MLKAVGVNEQRTAKSGDNATTRIRPSASGRTLSRSNSKNGRQRNSARTPIDKRRTSSGGKLKISDAIAEDRRKSNSGDKLTSNVASRTNSVRIRNSGAGSISSVKTTTNKGDKQKSSDAMLTSNDGFKRNRTDGGLIKSVRRRNNDVTPNFNDAIRDREVGAALIRNVKLKTN